MYLKIIKISFIVLSVAFLVLPFFKKYAEFVEDIMDDTLYGEMLGNILEYLEDGFDNFGESLIFVGVYLLYMFLSVLMVFFASLAWGIIVPALSIAGIAYFFKRNE